MLRRYPAMEGDRDMVKRLRLLAEATEAARLMESKYFDAWATNPSDDHSGLETCRAALARVEADLVSQTPTMLRVLDELDKHNAADGREGGEQ